MEKVKVLYFVDRMLRGGIQSLVIDWVSRFDKEKIHVDFLLLDDGNKYELEETLKKLGCNVYKLEGIWIRRPIDFIKISKSLNKFFKEHNDYKVVHLHSTSKNYIILKYAQKYGVPVRIAHSHALDFQSNSKVKKIVGSILKPKLIKYTNYFFACSEPAGEWLFGNNIIKSNKFKVISNAIDYNRFKFSKSTRNDFRKELGYSNNDIVLGHVGRFTESKNHKFIINVFYNLHKKNNNYKLLLIGTGYLENSIRDKVHQLGIEKNVMFLGYKENVNDYMQAMDIFIMPSIYEGLGLALVEAQASGLPCIATKGTIPFIVKINNNFKFVSLDLNLWINAINNVKLERVNSKENMKKSGYDIEDVIKELEEFYINV